MLALLSLLAILGDSLMAPGVSHELARYRAAHIRNVRYELTLDVTRRDTAAGTVKGSFTRVHGGDVYLDFRGHKFSDVSVNGVRMEAVEYNPAPMRFEAAALHE